MTLQSSLNTFVEKVPESLKLSAFAIILPNLIELVKYEVIGQQDINYLDLHENKWSIIHRLTRDGHKAGFFFDKGKLFLVGLKGKKLPPSVNIYIQGTSTTCLIRKIGLVTVSLQESKYRDAIGSIIRTQILDHLKAKGGRLPRYGSIVEFPKKVLYKDNFTRSNRPYVVIAKLATAITVRISTSDNKPEVVVYINPKIKQYYRGKNGIKPLKQKFAFQLKQHKKKMEQSAAQVLREIKQPGVSEIFQRVMQIRDFIGEFDIFGGSLSWELYSSEVLMLDDDKLNFTDNYDLTDRNNIREYLKENIPKPYKSKPIRVLIFADHGLARSSKERMEDRLTGLKEFAQILGVEIELVNKNVEYCTITEHGKLLPNKDVLQNIQGSVKKYTRSDYDIILFFCHGTGDNRKTSKASKTWDLITVGLGSIPCQRVFSKSFYYVEKDWLTVLLGILYKSRGVSAKLTNNGLPFDLSIGWDLSIVGKRGYQRSLLAAGTSVGKDHSLKYHYDKRGLQKRRSEKIPKNMLYDLLRSIIVKSGIKKIQDGILFIRDGLSFEDGQVIDQLYSDLINNRLGIEIDQNAELFLVEMVKRVVIRGIIDQEIPEAGTATKISDNELVIWTTNPGAKDGSDGLPQGLLIRLVYPNNKTDSNLSKIATQVYLNTFQRFTSTTKTRVPIQILLAEDVMRYIQAYLRIMNALPKAYELPEHIMS